MPLYEYRCQQCDTVFEQRRSMSDADAPTRCPSGHTDAKRLISVFAATMSSTPAGSGEPAMGPCGDACPCFDA